jgi:hypothetical protein
MDSAAVHKSDFESENLTANGAKAKAARTACICADDAAYTGGGFGWVRAKELARSERGGLQVCKNDTGTTAGATGLNFEIAKTFKGNDPAAVRNAGAGETGTCTGNRHRNVVSGCLINDLPNFANVCGNKDPVG